MPTPNPLNSFTPKDAPRAAHQGPAPMILYGIPTCDTCKKALKVLQTAGKDVTFRDIRATPLTQVEVDRIVQEFGGRAVNQQSITYRSFNDFLKASDPEAQIMAQPTVMKRPVIQDGDRWYLGWDSATEAALTS
jgi:arsenate reductase (glutaredoxin)